jgi:hypothetical protein
MSGRSTRRWHWLGELIDFAGRNLWEMKRDVSGWLNEARRDVGNAVREAQQDFRKMGVGEYPYGGPPPGGWPAAEADVPLIQATAPSWPSPAQAARASRHLLELAGMDSGGTDAEVTDRLSAVLTDEGRFAQFRLDYPNGLRAALRSENGCVTQADRRRVAKDAKDAVRAVGTSLRNAGKDFPDTSGILAGVGPIERALLATTLGVTGTSGADLPDGFFGRPASGQASRLRM